jgi:ATP-dependent Clp protease ATP-binding subunit ClpC
MNAIRKIEYYDLRNAQELLPSLIGRESEQERLTHNIDKHVASNVLLVGESGIGKTALIHGWLKRIAKNPAYDPLALVQLDAGHISTLEDDYDLEDVFADAFQSVPSAIVFVDNFGREIFRNPALLQRIIRLYTPLLKRSDMHVIFALEPNVYSWMERELPSSMQLFETLRLEKQSRQELVQILRSVLPLLNARHHMIVADAALFEIIACIERYSALGDTAHGAIRLLDESLAVGASRGERMLSHTAIAHVVEQKTGVPKAQVSKSGLEAVKTLESDLNARILSQTSAIKTIATTLQRAKLGLRSPDRPLGSFLMLGPSGVGKTETAKALAELLFGSSKSFLRFDMSEFQQDHTVQRLIGAPAGYVGYEGGGALTNALKERPHSLILLDEIEKAHPKVFDIFLQILDDGRLTSGQNETVDARNCIVMATSNAAVEKILDGYARGVGGEILLRQSIVPELAKTFRLEFLNRFDSIVLYQPLTKAGLMKIATLEMQKIERRFEKHRVRFKMDPVILQSRIEQLADPRFGARPVKRFIEETCETLLAQSLLNTSV